MLSNPYPAAGAAGTTSLSQDRDAVSQSPERSRRRAYPYVKFAFEYVLTLMMTLLAAPLIFALAMAVKLTSPGPAFYTQTRQGFRGRTYRIIKLRTMLHNCEAATGPVWSLPGDSRVTSIGRLLRDTHLDELPQLWNVLLGHMSLVGPRPERPEIAAKIERVLPEYRGRLTIRPGVTGLAQMRLPADTDLEGVRKKLAHDLYYVRKMSFLLDVRVAFSTAFYFIGAFSQAVCAALVRSYGRAVELGVEQGDLTQRETCEVGTA